MPAIRDVMGHKSTTMTERYAHATNEGKRRAVEAVLKPKHSSINIATRLPQVKVGHDATATAGLEMLDSKGFLVAPAGFEPTTKGL